MLEKKCLSNIAGLTEICPISTSHKVPTPLASREPLVEPLHMFMPLMSTLKMPLPKPHKTLDPLLIQVSCATPLQRPPSQPFQMYLSLSLQKSVAPSLKSHQYRQTFLLLTLQMDHLAMALLPSSRMPLSPPHQMLLRHPLQLVTTLILPFLLDLKLPEHNRNGGVGLFIVLPLLLTLPAYKSAKGDQLKEEKIIKGLSLLLESYSNIKKPEVDCINMAYKKAFSKGLNHAGLKPTAESNNEWGIDSTWSFLMVPNSFLSSEWTGLGYNLSRHCICGTTEIGFCISGLICVAQYPEYWPFYRVLAILCSSIILRIANTSALEFLFKEESALEWNLL